MFAKPTNQLQPLPAASGDSDPGTSTNREVEPNGQIQSPRQTTTATTDVVNATNRTSADSVSFDAAIPRKVLCLVIFARFRIGAELQPGKSLDIHSRSNNQPILSDAEMLRLLDQDLQRYEDLTGPFQYDSSIFKWERSNKPVQCEYFGHL